MDQRFEALRQAAVTLGASIVIAAAIIGWSFPDTARAPKYEGFVVDGKIVRLDTREGHVVACDFDRCVRVLGNGKNIDPNSAPGLPARGEASVPSVPAGIAAPGAPPQPTP